MCRRVIRVLTFIAMWCFESSEGNQCIWIIFKLACLRYNGRACAIFHTGHAIKTGATHAFGCWTNVTWFAQVNAGPFTQRSTIYEYFELSTTCRVLILARTLTPNVTWSCLRVQNRQLVINQNESSEVGVINCVSIIHCTHHLVHRLLVYHL